MGGRVAEELVLKHMTTGAGNDIEKATELARKMVCEWGMSELLGPLSFGKKEEHVFLGMETGRHKDFSEQTAIEIDSEIKRIVRQNYDRAKKLLEERIETLHAVAETLLDREVLDGAELDKIVFGDTIPQGVQQSGGALEAATAK
jgi:cell division protease FtsH